MKKLLSPLALVLLVTVLLSSSLSHASNVYAATASHVVISEILPGVTGATTNEFVELYNPTSSNIDVTGWRLSRKTAGGTESDLVTDFPAKTINAHGYLLIAHTDYTGSVAEDITYSANSFATNNTILLYDSADVVVDKVGMGSATDVEGTAKSDPSSPASIERKASSTSLASTLAIGGTEEFAGNGEDSDNNSSDFVNRGLSQPQSSASATEPQVGGTGTPTPTPSITSGPTPTVSATLTATNTPTASPSATVTPTPSLTATPSVTSTNTPTPTVSVTNSPTVTVSPTATSTPTPTVTSSPSPTVSVTNTPTVEPTLSVTSTPSPTISLSPTPTPVPHNGPVVLGTFQIHNKTVVCTLDVRVKRTRHWFTHYVPVVKCSEVEQSEEDTRGGWNWNRWNKWDDWE